MFSILRFAHSTHTHLRASYLKNIISQLRYILARTILIPRAFTSHFKNTKFIWLFIRVLRIARLHTHTHRLQADRLVCPDALYFAEFMYRFRPLHLNEWRAQFVLRMYYGGWTMGWSNQAIIHHSAVDPRKDESSRLSSTTTRSIQPKMRQTFRISHIYEYVATTTQRLYVRRVYVLGSAFSGRVCVCVCFVD